MTELRCPPSSPPEPPTEPSVTPETALGDAPPVRWPGYGPAVHHHAADDCPSEPPLLDPYLAAAPAPPPRAGLSPLAVASAVALILGPVGSILAIVFGHYARREIDRAGHRRAGYGLATFGMALGIVTTMAWGGVLSYFAWTLRFRADPAGEEAAIPAPPAAGAPAQPGAAPAAPPDPGPFAPKHTKVDRVGDITTVDMGSATPSLPEELARQRAEASAAGETLLVMTTAGHCDPCRGFDRSLRDPLLQTALAKVRLVRLDVHVFHEDLEQLKIPDEAIPGFYLLSLDLTPRDGVDGGEWDDDIPPNIAPVLGAFVRGKYGERRRPWHPVPATGMTL